MTHAISERRSMRRFDMRLPAGVKLGGESGLELATETRNISARGMYFHLPQPLNVGDSIAVTLTFPPHVTFTDKVRVRFEARVVRVELQRAPGAPAGIAAAIESYEFLRSYPWDDVQESAVPNWSQ